jgi:hypothetical protein
MINCCTWVCHSVLFISEALLFFRCCIFCRSGWLWVVHVVSMSSVQLFGGGEILLAIEIMCHLLLSLQFLIVFLVSLLSFKIFFHFLLLLPWYLLGCLFRVDCLFGWFSSLFYSRQVWSVIMLQGHDLVWRVQWEIFLTTSHHLATCLELEKHAGGMSFHSAHFDIDIQSMAALVIDPYLSGTPCEDLISGRVIHNIPGFIGFSMHW